MSGRDSNYKPTPRKRTNASDNQRRRSASPSSSPRQNVQQAPRQPSTAATSSFLFSRNFFILIGAILVLLLLILVLSFACGKQTNDQATNNATQGATQTAQQSNKNPGPYSVNFTTTGDLIFWREVADYIDANGGASAMANIADMLSQADVTISNVESPLSNNESEPIYDKDVYIIGRPSAIESIKNSGIDIASLANNHIMDYTGPALQDTITALDNAGVLHAGAGMTEAEAEKPVETEVNGVSIAFFSWTDIVPDNFVAYGDQPGVVSARLNMEDALRRVREAKETHDIVIVAMHWGIEYQDYIDDYQQRTPAHQLVDAGADVVLGNHPHVLQGIEYYNGSLIAYAHGNCVFRQAFEYGHTHESYVLNFDITESGIKNVVATPLYLDDTYGIPSVATGEQAQATLTRLVEISEDMNTAFEIRDGKAYVTPQS